MNSFAFFLLRDSKSFITPEFLRSGQFSLKVAPKIKIFLFLKLLNLIFN